MAKYKKIIDVNTEVRFVIERERSGISESYKSTELRLELKCDKRFLGFLHRRWKLWKRKYWSDYNSPL